RNVSSNRSSIARHDRSAEIRSNRSPGTSRALAWTLLYLPNRQQRQPGTITALYTVPHRHAHHIPINGHRRDQEAGTTRTHRGAVNTVTDIVKLTAADLHYIDEETYLRFAAGSVPLPPTLAILFTELRQSGTPAWPCTTSAHRHDCCSPGASPAARHPRSP
ncbi:MAG: hypothetical protein ACRDTT_20365, partial [Pseudonocardiaceae bacterium]